MKRKRTWAALLAAIVVAFPLATLGCSGGQGDGKTAKVQAGDMPSGAEWTGVYFSELYGYLHLVQDGNAISGKWIRPGKDRWGEVNGTVTGDVMHFAWTEHITGLAGPAAQKTGKGYFKYKRPPGDNVDDEIVGEIGRGNDEVGDPWDAIKQRHMNPDLKSIGGSGASDVGGGDWDKDNNEKGNPEPPTPPPAP